MGRSLKWCRRWSATHRKMGRWCAVKVKRPSDSATLSWGDTGLTAAAARLLAPHSGLSLFTALLLLLLPPAAFTHYLCSRTTGHTWIQCSGSNPAGHDSCVTKSCAFREHSESSNEASLVWMGLAMFTCCTLALGVFSLNHSVLTAIFWQVLIFGLCFKIELTMHILNTSRSSNIWEKTKILPA